MQVQCLKKYKWDGEVKAKTKGLRLYKVDGGVKGDAWLSKLFFLPIIEYKTQKSVTINTVEYFFYKRRWHNVKMNIKQKGVQSALNKYLTSFLSF